MNISLFSYIKYKFIFICIFIYADAREYIPPQEEGPKKICLNMIVKNESRVIRRCLDSVKGVIDTWVIVDTGSTDGTQKIIKQHLKDIPGKLYERRWRNFGENRSEAFELAKDEAEYILFMDADDVLEFDGAFDKDELTFDLYNMWRGSPGFTYLKPQIARASLPWKWVGVTHEYLGCDQFYTSATLDNVRYVTCAGGASSYDPKKFLKNVQLLEEGLKKEPQNARYMFYLAESLRDAGERGKALECYQKRVMMGGWEEEIFWSKLQIAHLLRDMEFPTSTVLDSYLQAHIFRPQRVEPVYFLAELYNKAGSYESAYLLIKNQMNKPQAVPKDSLFNMDWIEQYGLLFQLSIASYFVGQHEESLAACDQLLTLEQLPATWREQTNLNREFPLEKIIPNPEKNFIK